MIGPALGYVLCCLIGHSRDLVWERDPYTRHPRWRCSRCMCVQDWRLS